jgi:transposase InsO family protein
LRDRSRKPSRCPTRTAGTIEQAVVRLRDAHPAWGGRKIAVRLATAGLHPVPHPSTITGILRRHGRLRPEESAKHRPWQRFEHAAPNDLWQMDFKGHFPMATGRCYPLTILDDHSRFSLAVRACPDQTGPTVQTHLIDVFRRYGLPQRLLVDNGSPWGDDREHPYTPLTVWLIRVGVGVTHCRPYHPQTQGKDERFHRTLKAEVLTGRTFVDLADCQIRFDDWRTVYNCERPHQALDMATPVRRYRTSGRPYPEVLPPIEYGPDDTVRKVQAGGELSYRGRTLTVGKAFRGYPVALRPTAADDVYDVVFCHQTIRRIDLKTINP